MKKKCNWLRHNYGEWRITGRFNVLSNWDNKLLGQGFFQERKCKDCGYTKIEEQKS